MIETLLLDLKVAWRGLVKSPAYTLVAVTALALGIGANSAIFSVVNAVLLRPLPYPRPAGLMSVWESNSVRGWHKDVCTPADFIDWRDQNHVFESMAAYHGHGFNLKAAGSAERIRGVIVSADFLRVLGIAPVLGRGFLPGDGRAETGRVAVVSHDLWKRRFGAEAAVVGRPFTLDSESVTLIGVMPEGFEFPERAEMWLLARNVVPESPFLPADASITRVRGMHYFEVIARLKDPVTPAQAQAEMDAIARRLARQFPDTNASTGVEIIPLHEALTGDVRPALLVFLGAVGFVLLIACANVANMSLARSSARRREIAVRAALGATRARLLRLCLTESVLLSVAGGAAGVLLALWGVDLLVAARPDSLPEAASIAVDLRVLGFTAALSILTGILSGLAPALHMTRADPQEALREGGRGASAGPRLRLLRDLLVVSEIAVALVLLAGAGLLTRSFLRLQSVDPGLRVDRLLTLGLWLPEARYGKNDAQQRFGDELLRRVAALPGVERAAITTDLPMGGNDSVLGFQIEGRAQPPADQTPESGLHQVSPDYFRTLGIPLMQGRPLEPGDRPGAPSAAVVSRTLAQRYWPGENPVGKRISFGTNERNEVEWTTIVGVAADVRQKGLQADLRPETYVAQAQWPSRYLTLMVRSRLEPEGLTASVRTAVQGIDSELPLYGVKTMREVLDGSLSDRRFNMSLLLIFAGVAVLLAAVGLYGVMAYMVTQRTHEIGLRMALGARQGDVLRLVVGQGMMLTLAGVVAGLLGSWGLTRVLASLLVGVGVTDPWTFVTVPLVLAAVAFLASWIPARRAARVDPMVALRCE